VFYREEEPLADEIKEQPNTLGGLIITLAVLFFPLNFAAQLAFKPTELYRFAGIGSSKSVRGTWIAYETEFKRHATDVMTPDFLAGLAYTESSGNPSAQPPWVWRLTLVPWRLYAPASSAVGLMQITDGNLQQAGRYCIKDGRPATSGCLLTSLYSRLSPSDSIEMTSAYLHVQVARVAPKKTTLRRRQELAAVMHLCGPDKGPAFVRAGFDSERMGVCGRQAVRPYVRRVMRLREEFAAFMPPPPKPAPAPRKAVAAKGKAASGSAKPRTGR
jgi:hypothetical protein